MYLFSCSPSTYRKTPNDPPSPLLPHSKPQPMTTNRSSCSTTYNLWASNLISSPHHKCNKHRTTSHNTNHISMMTRHHPRKHVPRTPHQTSTNRPSLRNNSIYYLRNSLLSWVFLSFLSFQPRTNPRTRRLLTPKRDSPPKPL